MLRNKTKDKDTLHVPRVTTENFESNDSVTELHKTNMTARLRTNSQNESETAQDSATSSPRNRKRSKRFEEALMKWQEYGNDIIERKPPNFLELKNKPKKGTWIYAGERFSERPEFDESLEASETPAKLYQKHVEELSARLNSNLRDFEAMHERSAKIELTLKQLKEKVMANLEE